MTHHHHIFSWASWRDPIIALYLTVERVKSIWRVALFETKTHRSFLQHFFGDFGGAWRVTLAAHWTHNSLLMRASEREKSTRDVLLLLLPLPLLLLTCLLPLPSSDQRPCNRALSAAAQGS
jgi:apolipoprotein N-acyltransferase